MTITSKITEITGRHGPLSMETGKITNLGTPTAAGDAATKAYVDQAGPASGLVYTPGVTADWPGTDPNDVAEALDKLAARTDLLQFVFGKPAADAAAADATAETLFAVVPRAGTILSATFYPSDALTAHDTNFATLLLDKRDGAGGAAANVATLPTTVAGGSWTAMVGKSLGTISNATVAAGNVLTFEITKDAAGVVVPSGVLVVAIEPAAGA